ncbi:hypothetical protein BDY24DRAFT_387968 [Mrakia frigida]|uniref:uncharacterized protein n=1 Tax=Mrakia frigida TaxID=29902 RepID=UPI003FCC1CB2
MIVQLPVFHKWIREHGDEMIMRGLLTGASYALEALLPNHLFDPSARPPPAPPHSFYSSLLPTSSSHTGPQNSRILPRSNAAPLRSSQSPYRILSPAPRRTRRPEPRTLAVLPLFLFFPRPEAHHYRIQHRGLRSSNARAQGTRRRRLDVLPAAFAPSNARSIGHSSCPSSSPPNRDVRQVVLHLLEQLCYLA